MILCTTASNKLQNNPNVYAPPPPKKKKKIKKTKSGKVQLL